MKDYVLYVERSQYDQLHTEVLMAGPESYCRTELKNTIEAIRQAGRVLGDVPDIHSLVRVSETKVTQFVASALGTKAEVQCVFTVCPK